MQHLAIVWTLVYRSYDRDTQWYIWSYELESLSIAFSNKYTIEIHKILLTQSILQKFWSEHLWKFINNSTYSINLYEWIKYMYFNLTLQHISALAKGQYSKARIQDTTPVYSACQMKTDTTMCCKMISLDFHWPAKNHTWLSVALSPWSCF